MKKINAYGLFVMGAVMGIMASGSASYYLAGNFNGWNEGSHPMTETWPGSGIWSLSIPGVAAGQRQEFKVTDGTWDWNYPSANSWYYTDAKGNITVTFNTNTVSDGWQPEQYRLGLSAEPGTWTIAGNFQGWNNANPATQMAHIGDGIYQLSVILEPGTYEFKPVVTGSWDSISWDGRSEATANMSVTTTQEHEVVDFYVDALRGVVGLGMDVDPISRPYDPYPAFGQADVPVDDLVLSWSVAQVPSVADPNILGPDPNLVSHDIFISDGTWGEPNLMYLDSVIGWDPETLRISYTPAKLNENARYFWRVDMVMDDGTTVKGRTWRFLTELTRPLITRHPVYQIIEEGDTAVFSVAVSSGPPVMYQWYKVVDDGDDIALMDDGAVMGAETNTLTITGAGWADEGYYYCIIDNESGLPAVSEQAPLAIRRKLAHWDFEAGNIHSIVPGSPISFLHGTPQIVPTAGINGGDAMVFEEEQLLYTDPNEASYFDICNYEMTVAVWVKTTNTETWVPFVARNGEAGEGWQLRQNGFTADRPCFTTRGTGFDDGTAADRTVYDGLWHYVVGTYDGANGIKKVYIDGVLATRFYSSEDGSLLRNGDPVSGTINATPSPVSIAGRVRGAAGSLIIEDWQVCVGTYDEVAIYNYALDAETIAQRYADITGTAVCPAAQLYDLDGDCVVNLNDFALLASEWLNDNLVWPTP